MPIYEYFCDTCSHSFDIKQRFQDESLTVCPSCNQKTLRKVFHASGIVFKGSGFYKTDSQDRSKKSSTGKNTATDTSKEPTPTTTTPTTTPLPSESSSKTTANAPTTSSPTTPSGESKSDNKASS